MGTYEIAGEDLRLRYRTEDGVDGTVLLTVTDLRSNDWEIIRG